jgi:hypothetical protein
MINTVSTNKTNIQIFGKNDKISQKDIFSSVKKDNKKAFTIDKLKVSVEKYTLPTSPKQLSTM